MTFYAIVRSTRHKREWMSFYKTLVKAQAVCDSMNAQLDKRTIPYEVVPVTPQD